MTALLLAALLAGLPSPPTPWTRAQVEARWGPPTMAGPVGDDLPWDAGSIVASHFETPGNLDGICRRHLGAGRNVRWVALLYYSPSGHLVAAHCMRLDDLDTGYDVLPDVVRRLEGGRT